MAPHRTALLLLPLLLITGVRCQLDTTRGAASAAAAESSGEFRTDMPSLSAIFSTLLPNLNRNATTTLADTSSPAVNTHSNGTDTSVSPQSSSNSETIVHGDTSDTGTSATESASVDTDASRREEPVEVNLITPVLSGESAGNVTTSSDQNNSSHTTELASISTNSANSSTPSRPFSPSAIFTLSNDEFQPRSGLVEDIYDYANDFGDRLSSQGSPSSQSHSQNTPTLPTLYPRDQPEDLVPFEEIRRGSQTVRHSGRPSADWQPNWPSDLVPTPVPINVRDTSSHGLADDVPSVFHSPEPTSVGIPNRKDPITQYYFDLSDAASPSSNIPGPLFDPSSATATVAPRDSLNTSSPNSSVTERPHAVELQPSLSVSDELVSSSSVTPGVTPGLTLTTGIAINKIYSSAFFPTALPTAIHVSNTDSLVIEPVHNDIASELQLHPTETNASDLRVSNISNAEHTATADESDSTGIRSGPDYILGSDADYFPTSSGRVDQDLEFTGTSNRHPEREDEIALGSGNFPGLSFALPTAISTSAALASFATSQVERVASRLRSTSAPRNKLPPNTRPSSGESRKPLWMLLSKTEPSAIDMTPTPTLGNPDFVTDFPVGILSNRVPIHQTSVNPQQIPIFDPSAINFDMLPTPVVPASTHSSSLPSFDLESSEVSASARNTISPTSVLSINLQESTISPSSVSLDASSVNTELIESRSPLADGIHLLNNTWIPLVNDSMVSLTEHIVPDTTDLLSTSTSHLLPTPVVKTPELTGGFTPVHNQLVNTTNSMSTDDLAVVKNTVSTSMTPVINVIIPLEDGFAPIAPTNIFAPDFSTSSSIADHFVRSDLETNITAPLHNVADSIVSSHDVLPTAVVSFASPTATTFGDEFTFRLTSPYPPTSTAVSPSSGVFSSVVLVVTPKSSGESGINGTLPSTTPFPTWFSRPFDYSSFERVNSTTEVEFETDDSEASTFSRKPTTYVYPQESLVTSEATPGEHNLRVFVDITTAASDIVEESTVPEEAAITEPSPTEPEITTQPPSSTTSTSTTTSTEIPTEEEESTPILFAVEEIEDTTTTTTTTSAPTTTTTSTTELPTTTTTTEATTTETTTTSTTTSRSTTPSTVSENEISKPVTVEPPELTTITHFGNGTREFSDVPFMRALLAVDTAFFCRNRLQYATLLSLWLGAELNDSSSIEPSDIHFFGEPYCDELLDSNTGFLTSDPLVKSTNGMHTLFSSNYELGTTHTEDLPVAAKLQGSTVPMGSPSDATYLNGAGPPAFSSDPYTTSEDAGRGKTNVYFYVSQDGAMDVNLTQAFPLFPKEINLPDDMQTLANTVLLLELVRPKSASIQAGIPPGGDLSSPSAGLGTVGIVAIVVAAALLLVTVIAVVIFVMYRRKQAVDNYYGKRCTPVSMDAYSVDSVSVYHSFRRKSKRNRSNRSVKSYLNQGFEDPNGPTRPLDFAQLTHFISDMDGVHQEFATIPVSSPNYDDLPPNVQDKNRYANVIPVPETRVLLKGFKDSPEKQYINANYVKGPHNEAKYFIATQAPLESTVGDFWRMVWEQETRVVVMLTDFVERGIDKCADYLPPSQTLDCHRVYGDFQVTLKSRDMQEKFVVSGVLLKNLENNLTRDISHMWFTGWPVMGVPHTEKPFISFVLAVRRARKQLRAKGPVVVHCSPGTGRTGTFLAVEHCMRQFEQDRAIDVAKTVYNLRRERAGAVQTSDQYCFIYRVINLYASKLSSGNLDSL